MFQLMMLVMFSLVFGPLVFADNDSDDDDGKRWHQKSHHDDDDGFNDGKWHDKWQAKLDKKTAKYQKKLAKHANHRRSQEWQEKKNVKFTKWQEKHEKKLARHNAKHHTDVVPTPAPTSEPVCTAWFNGVCVAFAN